MTALIIITAALFAYGIGMSLKRAWGEFVAYMDRQSKEF
jgi:hypothetical protein